MDRLKRVEVLLRCDAGVELGSGHVMRCLVLAAQLREAGWACGFLCRRQEGHLADLIEREGHVLGWLDGDGVGDEAEDAEQCLAWLQRHGAGRLAWLVVDHYRLGAAWEARLRQATGARLLVIDGQAQRSHDADILLDPVGTQPGRWAGLVDARCHCLLGPQHALLRAEFRAAAAAGEAAPAQPPRLLLAFGGTDPPNASARVLQALQRSRLAGVPVDVLAGAANPHLATLDAACARYPAARLHVQPADVAGLMRRATLAVCAGGGTLLELCALRVPAVVLCIAANQLPLAQQMHAQGAALHLGPLASMDARELVATVAALLGAPQRLAAMRAAAARALPHMPPALPALMRSLGIPPRHTSNPPPCESLP